MSPLATSLVIAVDPAIFSGDTTATQHCTENLDWGSGRGNRGLILARSLPGFFVPRHSPARIVPFVPLPDPLPAARSLPGPLPESLSPGLSLAPLPEPLPDNGPLPVPLQGRPPSPPSRQNCAIPSQLSRQIPKLLATILLCGCWTTKPTHRNERCNTHLESFRLHK